MLGGVIMTVRELLDIDITDVNKFNEKTLRAAVQTLSSAANKRVRRINAAGVISPAVRAVEQHGNFTPKGKNRNQLLSEFVRAVNFLQSETSTVAGARKFTDNIRKNLGLNKTATAEEIASENKGFWNTFTDLYNNAQNLWTHSRLGSPKIQQIITDIRAENPNATWQEISDRAQAELDKLYIEESAPNGTADFFDFGEYD